MSFGLSPNPCVIILTIRWLQLSKLSSIQKYSFPGFLRFTGHKQIHKGKNLQSRVVVKKLARMTQKVQPGGLA